MLRLGLLEANALCGYTCSESPNILETYSWNTIMQQLSYSHKDNVLVIATVALRTVLTSPN